MLNNLSKNIVRWINLVSIPRYYWAPHPEIKHLGVMAMKSSRRLFLNKTVLNQTKQVIYASIRKPSDSVIQLKKQGKCPGVIIPAVGDQQIDIVLDGNKMNNFTKHPNYSVETVYIRVDGKQTRCVLAKIDTHQQGFVTLVTLKEYIVGHPNRVHVPIQISHFTENPYVQSGGQFHIKVQSVDIICYNDEYPNKFMVDISYVSPERSYKLADIANLFPPGILLAPDVDPNRNVVLVQRQDPTITAKKKQRVLQYLESQKKKLKESKELKAQGQTQGGDKQAGTSTTTTKATEKTPQKTSQKSTTAKTAAKAPSKQSKGKQPKSKKSKK